MGGRGIAEMAVVVVLFDGSSKNREGGAWSYGVVAHENRRVGRGLQINFLLKYRLRYA